jgi:hypothetical protein
MAAPTILAQNDRIRAIMAAYPGIGTDVSEGAALAALPAFIVNPLGTTQRQKAAAKRWLVTREFEVIGLITAVSGDTGKWVNRAAAYEAAEPVLEAWIAWIDAHPRLSLNDGGLVVDTGEILDGGFGPYTYPADGTGKDYGAFRFVIPVTTYRP